MNVVGEGERGQIKISPIRKVAVFVALSDLPTSKDLLTRQKICSWKAAFFESSQGRLRSELGSRRVLT